MASKRREVFVIEVHNVESGEMGYYGPYTSAQADRVAKQMARFFARQAKAYDDDEPDEQIVVCRLGRWQPPEIQRTPTRPNCPECGVKIGVWEASWGQVLGSCNNTKCECYHTDFTLEEKGGKWVICNG